MLGWWFQGKWMIHLSHCPSDPAYYIVNWRDFIYNDFGWCRSWQKKRRKRDVCGKVGQYYALEQKNRKPRVAAKLTQCTILTNFVSHQYFSKYIKRTQSYLIWWAFFYLIPFGPSIMEQSETYLPGRKDVKSYPGFDPITFTFSKKSNYGRERLLEV